jgi:ankyrin repeat protein
VREREREGERKRERDEIRDMSPARVRQDGVTGLYMAAQNGHAEALRLLVEGKADVNAAKKVHTPLRGLRV